MLTGVLRPGAVLPATLRYPQRFALLLKDGENQALLVVDAAEIQLSPFTSPARHRLGNTRSLRYLPLLDRSTIEPPIATNAKAGQAALSQQSVYGSGMDAEMLR